MRSREPKYTLIILIMICSMQFAWSIPGSTKNDTIILKNKGVSGNATHDLLQRVKEDVLDHNPDLVILMVGTNDFLNPKKMISFQKYEANLNKIVRSVQKNGAQVLLVSPPTADSVYLFQRHGGSSYHMPPNVLLDSARHINNRVAKNNDLLFLDVFQVFFEKGLPEHNTDSYIKNEKNSNKKDGVHPTPLGYKLIADSIYNYLLNQNLEQKFSTIICFGDSITFGAGTTEGGTIYGENYPSYLYLTLKNNR